MRLLGTKLGSISTGRGLGDSLYDNAGASPSLDQRFAESKSLTDAVTGQNLITFTRASGATYVDSQGVIRQAVTNLLLRSEEFDTGWTGSESNTTVTANTNTAPNGTLTADTINFTNTSSYRYQLASNTPAGTTYTFSVWLASGTKAQTVIRIAGTVTGTGGQLVVNLTPTLTRCSLTVTIPSGNTAAFVGFENRTGVGGGDGSTGTIIAWGAQLEQASAVGEYVPTTSVINSAPRFDHNPTTGESLGLLVEEARTNLLTASEETVTAPWGLAAATGVANNGVAPDGTTTADKIISTGGGCFRAGIGVVNATAYTYSVFLKYVAGAGTINQVGFERFGSTPSLASLSVNLIAGTITNNGASVTASSITPYPNNWYRISVTATSTDVTLNVVNYAAASGNEFLVWGAQLEAGAFPTSYIPTTSATVTRAADVASITGANFSSWYNQTEGTVFMGYLPVGLRTSYPLSIDDGTTSNFIGFGFDTSGNRFGRIDTGGVTQASITQGLVSVGSESRVAMALATNNVAASFNGAAPTADTSVTIPTVDRARLHALGGSSTFAFNGHYRRLCYWPQRLGNEVLQRITT